MSLDEEVFSAIKRKLEEFIGPFKPSCKGLARKLSLIFSETASEFSLNSVSPELAARLKEYLQELLSKHYRDCSMKNFMLELKINSRNVPRARMFWAALSEEVGMLFNRFEESKAYRAAEVKPYKVRLYAPLKSGKRFSEVLGVSPEKVKEAFGFDEDPQLYSHQLEALEALSQDDVSAVIVSTPNASGKTEIGMLYALRLVEGGADNILILAVYPTRALARDQFERWSERFEALEGVKPVGDEQKIGARSYFLKSEKLALALLDGETIKKYDPEALDDARALVVFTNPQFLLSTLQTKHWEKYFGKRCLLFLVLDEVHFYTTYDLTLLATVLNYAIEEHGCRMGGRIRTKVLVLSATMGNPDEFKDSLRKELQALEGQFKTVTGVLDRSTEIGTKSVFLVKVRDDRQAEGIVKGYLEEIIGKAKHPDGIEKTLVFVPNRNTAERLWKALQSFSSKKVEWLSRQALVERHLGDMALWEREAVEEQFKRGETRILITVKTLEVGIDIGDVTRIIHWGLPPINDFVQREGRAGRRPGAYESLIVISNAAEEVEAKRLLELLMSPDELVKRTHTPLIEPEAYLIRAIKDYIRQKGAIPKKVQVCPEGRAGELKVSFYTQEGGLFKLVEQQGGRPLKGVRKYDVIFRYLPGMIRSVGHHDYIVTKINNKSEVQLKGLLDAMYEVWRNLRSGDLKELLKQVEQGRLFTVGDVDVSFEVYGMCGHSLSADNLNTLKVTIMPLGTKLIEKDEKPKMIKPGLEIKVPVFRIIDERPIGDGSIQEYLTMQLLTRGVYVKKRLNELEALYDTLIKRMNEYVEVVNNKTLIPFFDKSELSLKEIMYRQLRFISKSALLEYTHLALHLLLNKAHEQARLRPDEIEHYVRVGIDSEEALRSFINDLLSNRRASASPPLTVEFAITSYADLVKRVNWIEVLEMIGRLKEDLEKGLDRGGLGRATAELYARRCFVVPTYIEDILKEGEIEGPATDEAIKELKVVAEVSEQLAREIIKYFIGA